MESFKDLLLYSFFPFTPVHEHYWTSMSVKSRMRVKYNTWVKNVLPLAKARESLSDQAFELIELQRGRGVEMHENLDLMKHRVASFQVASFVVNLSAARTLWRWSNIHFVSKHEITGVNYNCGRRHLLPFSSFMWHLAAFPAAAQNDLHCFCTSVSFAFVCAHMLEVES